MFQRRDAIVEPFISPRLNASETVSTTEKIPNNRQKGYEQMLQPLMLERRGKKGFSPTDQNVIPSNKLIKVIGNLSTTYFTAEWSSGWRTLRNVSGLTSKIPSLASAITFHKKKTRTDVQRYLKFESCDRFLIEILLGNTNSPDTCERRIWQIFLGMLDSIKQLEKLDSVYKVFLFRTVGQKLARGNTQIVIRRYLIPRVK